MNQSQLNRCFGQCYNNKDYTSITGMLSNDVQYESFDCMYLVSSSKRVYNVLVDSTIANTQAYYGYYKYPDAIFKRLRECVLICYKDTLVCDKIVCIKCKRGKIIKIIGIDANEYSYTRGKLIKN